MSLTIVILTFQRPLQLEACLNSLAHQEQPLSYRLIVIINGPDKTSKNIVNKLAPDAEIIELTSPSFPGAARNHALGLIQTEYTLFLDDDITLPPNYFLTLEEILKEKPALFGGPDLAPLNGTFFQKSLGLAQQSPLCSAHTRYRHGGETQYHRPMPDGNEFILCNMGVQSRFFHEFGLRFDERFARNEENILIRQIQEISQHFIFSTQLFVYHEKKTDLISLSQAVLSSGKHRLLSFYFYPKSFSAPYLMPLVFLIYVLILPMLDHIPYSELGLQLYIFLVVLLSWKISKQAKQRFLSFALIAYIQIHIILFYALGTLCGVWEVCRFKARALRAQ